MATLKQKKAFREIGVNGGNISKAMSSAGYSPSVSKRTDKLTNTVGWKELMDKYLPDSKLGEKHQQLLNSTKVEHMVFPLGPKGEDDPDMSGARPELEEDGSEEDMDALEAPERTTLTDEQIKKMLAGVSCTVKQIVHGNTARHVYFWASDNKAVKDALDMAYKLKGHYASEKSSVIVGHIEITPEIMAKSKSFDEYYKEHIGGNSTSVHPRLDPVTPTEDGDGSTD